MRYWILIFLCAISFSASAQWWHVDNIFRKRRVILPLEHVRVRSVTRVPDHKKFVSPLQVQRSILPVSEYHLEAAERLVMGKAQHNMRFRIYDEASYNFSDLADLYVKQDRLSEAKWYYLQSNLISRQQNDDKHTISNLMALAMIKAQLGDFIASEQDLVEARDIARSKGMQTNLLAVDKESKYIQDNKSTFIRTEVRYAEAATADNKDGKKTQ